MARATKRVCRDCGFMVPMAGALGAMFGVCCNELAADGRVVDFFYGCGAHSDTPAPPGTGSPAFDPYDDGVVEVVELPADVIAEPVTPEPLTSEPVTPEPESAPETSETSEIPEMSGTPEDAVD